MKLAVLTTDTIHHAYFVGEIARHYRIDMVFIETNIARAAFPTSHRFEEERDAFEKVRWFSSGIPALESMAPTAEYPRMNDREATERLQAVHADVVIVFGTGKLNEGVIACCPGRTLNLHGGDPELYRGLDSHLWAIYHRDFAALVTTLHQVNTVLDDGQIVMRKPVVLHKDMRLCELRAANTELCASMVLLSLAEFQSNGRFDSTPQKQVGRYYSFMPTPLKDICVRNFETHTRGL